MKPVSVNALKEKMKLTKMDAFKKMTNLTRKKQHKKKQHSIVWCHEYY